MDRIKRARPSPAILIAALALVAAVAGTAIAGPVATTSKLSKDETKKVKKIAKKKANKQIEKKAPGLDVNSATNADKVDGHDAACLAETTAIAGFCYDTAARAAANWKAASADCGDENASLPTVGELLLAIDELGIAGAEWTDNVIFATNGNLLGAAVVDSGGLAPVVNIAATEIYRCVRPLVR